MAIFNIDPLLDDRWSRFLLSHPDASVFHTKEWLAALKLTYGYEPVVYTTNTPGDELDNGIPLCHVDSWITGKRLVSVPFSDHCQPLIDTAETYDEICSAIIRDVQKAHLKYVELRPYQCDFRLPESDTQMGAHSQFYYHRVSLSESLEEIFARFNKDSVKKKLRKADQDNVVYQEGLSESLLNDFYAMLIKTRRKHGVPPQPMEWFKNLIECLGTNMKIRVAYKDDVPVVALVTSYYKRTYFTKYSCSNTDMMGLSGTHMKVLMWQAIQEAKELGCSLFDMGRCDTRNAGLCEFKDNFGSIRSVMEYHRYPLTKKHQKDEDAGSGLSKRIFAVLPDKLLCASGKLLYKHVG